MINILIAGVGGQGSLLASRVIGRLFTSQGFVVKMSEVHGMSQRGGSVVTYVRADRERVSSPLIEKGDADILLGFEGLEGVRWLPYLKEGGAAVVNLQPILPMPVISGAADYPSDVPGKIRAVCANAILVDALALALEAGSVKAVNTVVIGAASAAIGFAEKDWKEAITHCVKERFVDLNLAAFDKGRKAASPD